VDILSEKPLHNLEVTSATHRLEEEMSARAAKAIALSLAPLLYPPVALLQHEVDNGERGIGRRASGEQAGEEEHLVFLSDVFSEGSGGVETADHTCALDDPLRFGGEDRACPGGTHHDPLRFGGEDRLRSGGMHHDHLVDDGASLDPILDGTGMLRP